MITLGLLEWQELRKKISAEHPPATLLIRACTRETLGFTPRDYRYFDAEHGHYVFQVCLDFYDEAKETWFRLKYL